MIESLATQSETLENRISQLACIPPVPDPKGHVNTIKTRRENETESSTQVEENVGIEEKCRQLLKRR